MNRIRYVVTVSVVAMELDEENVVVGTEELWDDESRLFESEEAARNLAREAMVVVSQESRPL